MKIIRALFLTFALAAIPGCSGSQQGHPVDSVPVNLSFATNESGTIEVFSVTKGTSLGKMTTGTLSISVLQGANLKAVWTPATGDTNTASYWINSTTPNVNQASSSNQYTFAAVSGMKVQMHLLAPANNVQMVPSAYGVTSWTINGVAGQVAAGGTTATISVRKSDQFNVSWDANGTAAYISVWDVAGPVTTDRSIKDTASTSLVIGADTTISAEVSYLAPPHYRLQIPKPLDGELDFTNPDSGTAITFAASSARFGNTYEVLTDNAAGTSATLAITYKDNGANHGLASYTVMSQTTAVTTTAGTPNSDHSATFTNTWNCSLANSGADVPLTTVADTIAASCTKIGQLMSGGVCYDGTAYCAVLGQSYNGTSCF